MNRAVVEEEEEAGALTSTLRCFHCHELTAWIGFCVHCGKPLFPVEPSEAWHLLIRRSDRRITWLVQHHWPDIIAVSRALIDDMPTTIQWESPWSIRITLDNGWAVYALSTMSRIRGFCVGRLVDSELSPVLSQQVRHG